MISQGIIIQATFNWFVLSLIYSLTALGMTFIFSILGVLNFTHGTIYMLGGYIVYYSVVRFGFSYIHGLILSFLLTGIFGLVLYKGLLKRFRKEHLLALIITIGAAYIMESSAYIGFGSQEKQIPSVFNGVVNLAGSALSLERLVVGICALALIFLVFLTIERTKLGRAMRAVVLDEMAASLQGINPEIIYLTGMFIGCGLAGIAGGLTGPVFGISPSMGHLTLINAFIIIIIGGLGSFWGAIAGAFVLGFVTSFGGTFLGGPVAQMINFAALIFILLVKPTGLIPVAKK